MSDPKPDHVKWAYRAGIIAQGVVLGVLLFLALINLWAEADNVRLFRYQNF
ncbi:MAG: hypothetical protein NXH70_05725 [Hyphomonas sp.]|nr:hypothetical protein [Henriciella sp.]MBO6696894.1 hypothetical protein [Henriciella sp.]MCH9751411.1 hypothetical protein [Alphaproteobacteria bacterium]MCR9223551.1 hypothetical protein [Hyphomonas sp.]